MTRTEIHNRVLVLVAEMRERFDLNEIERHFVNRTLEDEFAKIGDLKLQRPDAPRHIAVWTGFEVINKEWRKLNA